MVALGLRPHQESVRTLGRNTCQYNKKRHYGVCEKTRKADSSGRSRMTKISTALQTKLNELSVELQKEGISGIQIQGGTVKLSRQPPPKAQQEIIVQPPTMPVEPGLD